MRPFLLLITLLTSAAFAQPHVGAEIPSSAIPLSRAPWLVAQPAVAMAADGEGVAIAWSMQNDRALDRVYVARLDGQGHVSGAVKEMPVLDPAHLAFAPSMARSVSGSGFTIAWVESLPDFTNTTPHAVFAQLDVSLTPSAPQRLFDLQTPTPIAVRSGSRTWVTAGALISEITAGGAAAPLSSLRASDIVVAGDTPQIVARENVSRVVRCACDPGPHAWGCTSACPNVYGTTYSLQFMSLYRFSSAQELPFASAAEPAIGSDRRTLVIAWMDGDQSAGGQVVAARSPLTSANDFYDAVSRRAVIGTFARDAGATRPDIASDGRRTIIVWRTRKDAGDHDIVGAVLDRDGSITNISIAASPADERDPSIIALSNGTFLVAYESMIGFERRITGRFITFGDRRRATSR